MKVWFVSPEVEPFRKTGGLGDVCGALPRALGRRGLDVRVVMPLHRGAPWDALELLDGEVEVPMHYGPARFAVRLGHLPRSDVRVYFIEHHGYFDRPEVYGGALGPYGDNLERFAFFSRASLALSRALGFEPDVVHAHDWSTALLPALLDTDERHTPLGRAASVFTIHNLAHQGTFEPDAFPVTGLPESLNASDGLEHFGSLNLMKGGIRFATAVTTVSPNYALEIQAPELGQGLDGVLRARPDGVHGILNGIDTEEWDPRSDPHLRRRYDFRTLEGKRACKAALQRELGLPVRPDVPLFGVVARLTHQKGLDVLAESLRRALSWEMQVVVHGSGRPELAELYRELERRYPTRLAARPRFDNALAHRIEAGSDFFVMPSRFEPCGLNQMYSLRYGAVPIVRRTGGLVDTVESYDEATRGGTGFVFDSLDADSLTNTLGWALSTYYDRPRHYRAIQRRGMKQDFSWNRSAGRYERLYAEAVSRRRGEGTFAA